MNDVPISLRLISLWVIISICVENACTGGEDEGENERWSQDPKISQSPKMAGVLKDTPHDNNYDTIHTVQIDITPHSV